MQNWSHTSLMSKMKDLAERRKLEDLTIGPVLTVSLNATTRKVFQAMLVAHNSSNAYFKSYVNLGFLFFLCRLQLKQ